MQRIRRQNWPGYWNIERHILPGCWCLWEIWQPRAASRPAPAKIIFKCTDIWVSYRVSSTAWKLLTEHGYMRHLRRFIMISFTIYIIYAHGLLEIDHWLTCSISSALTLGSVSPASWSITLNTWFISPTSTWKPIMRFNLLSTQLFLNLPQGLKNCPSNHLSIENVLAGCKFLQLCNWMKSIISLNMTVAFSFHSVVNLFNTCVLVSPPRVLPPSVSSSGSHCCRGFIDEGHNGRSS